MLQSDFAAKYIAIRRKFLKLMHLHLITELSRKDFSLLITITYDLFITAISSDEWRKTLINQLLEFTLYEISSIEHSILYDSKSSFFTGTIRKWQVYLISDTQ